MKLENKQKNLKNSRKIKITTKKTKNQKPKEPKS